MTARWQIDPGRVVLLGSGETTQVGGQVYDALVRDGSTQPRIRVMETPAGFELNSYQVAGRVAEYMRTRLQNYNPDIQVIPARARAAPFSTENPDVLAPLLEADLVYMGAGSPTYAVRQLAGSLAWEWIRARHRLGASLIFASAAAIACGARALPVYEVFKVGEDPHWKPGLDLLSAFGLRLVIVSHWNNAEGGADLDTSRCFIGQTRFDPLLAQVSPDETVVGLDEQTALLLDLAQKKCRVMGRGGIHLIRAGRQKTYRRDEVFSIRELGDFCLPEQPEDGIVPAAWRQAVEAQAAGEQPEPTVIPDQVLELVEQRQTARAGKNWQRSDSLRLEILELGYRVLDTPEGPKVEPR